MPIGLALNETQKMTHGKKGMDTKEYSKQIDSRIAEIKSACGIKQAPAKTTGARRMMESSALPVDEVLIRLYCSLCTRAGNAGRNELLN